MRCSKYCGITCVNGTCPSALADEYPEYGYSYCSCEECGYYKGCEDCCFADMCSKSEKEKYKDK